MTNRLPIAFFLIATSLAALLAGCSTLSREPGSPAAHGAGGSGTTSGQPRVVRATLSNGLQVVIVRDPLAPVVTQETTYFAGSNQSPPDFPGMAHAQEHMMFRGSPGITGNQLSEISAQLGGSMDAYTTEDTTTYYFTVPVHDLGLTLMIGSLRMSGIDDTPAAWTAERGAIEQEVARDNSDPLYVLQAKAQAHIFAGSPYAHTGLGTKPSFDKTTAAMIKRFWETWYAPNNALLVVSGDVNPGTVLAQIKRLYGPIPEKKLPGKAKIHLSPLTPQTFRSQTSQAFGMSAYVFRMPALRSPDYPAAELLAAVLDSRRGTISALSYNGQALAAGFDYSPMVGAGYAYAWIAYPPGSDAKAMRRTLRDALEQAISKIPADLVTAQKRKALLGNDSIADSIPGLAGAWNDAIVLEGISSPAVDSARLQGVDRAALERVAQRELDFHHAVTLELTPTSGGNAQGGGQVFGKPESFGSTPSEKVTLPPWAATALERLPHPEPLFHPTSYTLPNGLKLVVQPVANSKTVDLFGAVNTNPDLEAPASEEGVGSLLDALYEWGPKGMSRSEFEAKMDALGANYAVGTGFAIQVRPKFFRRGVALVAKDLLDPALPESAFRSQQRIYARELEARTQSPQYKLGTALQHTLFPPGDPATRRATAKTVKSLTIAKVRAYAAKVVRPDEAVIVVTGAVKPAVVRSVIERAFGSWKAAGPRPDLHYPAIPASKPADVFVPDRFRRQDTVVLAETIDANDHSPDRFALSLGDSYLGGDLFASPLYRVLRVERGLVYQVSSSVDLSRRRGLFRISYGAYPDKVREARQLAIAQLEEMSRKPLTAAQLHLAKAAALRQIELSNQSIGDVAGSWLSYSMGDMPLDSLYLVANRYEKVTAAEIQAAFKKYVDPARLATFVLGRQPAK